MNSLTLIFPELYFQIMGKINTRLSFFPFFYPLGTLEDWDAAVQKTEIRLARVNEQRAKVRTFCELPKQFVGNTCIKVTLV